MTTTDQIPPLDNNQIHRIISAEDMGTIFLDLDLNITIYTPSATTIFNLSPNIHGQPISSIVDKLGYNELIDDLKIVLAELNEIENEIHFQNGSIYLFRLTPYRTDTNSINGLVITFINITQSKWIEEQLQIAEEHKRNILGQQLLRSVIDSSLDIIQVFKAIRDDQGKIIDFTWLVQNEKGFKQNGDVIGESVLKKNPGIVEVGIFERLVHVTETGISQELEQYYSFEQFSENWFYLAMVKQDDGVVMTTRDITDQVKAKKELLVLKDELAQKATDKYLNLFNSIDEGFCIIEVLFDDDQTPYDWRFLEVNPAFEKNNGLFNATGKTMVEMAPDIEPKWFDIYGSVAKTGKPLRFKEHSFALNRHFDLYAFPVDKAGENHVAVIFTDITRRILSEEALRNSEERLRITMENAVAEQKLFAEELSKLVTERTLELQRSNDDLRQFAHVASHDLKEPVRKIRTFNNRLLDEFEDILPSQAIGYIDRIESACARMYDMIEGVLHYSKLGSDSMPLEIVNLNEIISQIKTDLEVLIEMKKAEIIVADLPVIDADTALIYQLFYNLILNSLKFSKSDTPVRITILSSEVIKEDNKYFQITLTDNGIGFDSQYSENIFNTFTRLNSADLYEGSGLGLALCKKIVERYHGTISANSQPGNGATFTILFPLKSY